MSKCETAKVTDRGRTDSRDASRIPNPTATDLETRKGASASDARYSSGQQREDSIQDQQRKCREAAANDHHIAPNFQFYDEAVSGTRSCGQYLGDFRNL